VDLNATNLDVDVTSGNFDSSAGAFAFVANGATAGDFTVSTDDDLTFDATGTISLDSAAASNFTTSAGALTLTSAVAATWSTSAGNLDISAAGDLILDTTAGTISTNATLIEAGGALTIRSAAGTALTLDSSTTGTINIGTDSQDETINLGVSGNQKTINIGTGANTQTVALGSTNGASVTAINSGTGGLDITSTGTTLNALRLIATTNGGGIQIDASTGGLDMNANGGVVGLGTDLLNGAINIATGGAKTLTLGTGTFTTMVVNSGSYDLNSTGFDMDVAGNVNIDATGGGSVINIGVNDSQNSNITIGANSGTSFLDLYAGSGNAQIASSGSVTLVGGAAGQTIVLRPSTATGSILVDGGTTDRTSDLMLMDVDVNAANVIGFDLDLDVATALTSGKTATGMAISIDGVLTDNSSSNIFGLLIDNSTTTLSGGSETGIQIDNTGHVMDVGISMQWDATSTQHIAFGDNAGGDAHITYLQSAYTDVTSGNYDGLRLDASLGEVIMLQADTATDSYQAVFGPGNVDEFLLNEISADGSAGNTGLVFLIAETTAGNNEGDLFAVDASGTIYADSSSLSGADYAELMLDGSGDLRGGELVSIDTNGLNSVVRSSSATDAGLVGIVSTKPGVLGNNDLRTQSEAVAPIAFMGQVPVNVNDENGPIAVGDYITSSSTPGVGMRAENGDPTVAVALTTLESGTGRIQGLVSRNSGSNLQGGTSTGGMLSSGAATESTTTISVVSDSFSGSVSVAEHLYGSRDMAGRARLAAGATAVRVNFETAYQFLPIVNFSLRTDEYIPGRIWVSDEDTTGFTLNHSAGSTTDFDIELNWIAVGVEEAMVSVSDGTVEEVTVTVTSDVAAEAGAAVVAEEVIVEEVVVEEAAVEEVVVEEAAVEEVVVEEAAVEEVVAEATVEEPAAEEAAL
ncbi:MAG: hypothetical protein HQ488_02100, partial [Parcubacteria group bacterium]|nr:hypothetical protein [Parcubacteria group bacterium]